MDFPKSIEWLIGLAPKLRPKHLMGLGVACLVIIRLPQPWREFLYYDSLHREYAGHLGGIGSCSFVVGLIWQLAEWASSVGAWYGVWRQKRCQPGLLLGLSNDEIQRV